MSAGMPISYYMGSQFIAKIESLTPGWAFDFSDITTAYDVLELKAHAYRRNNYPREYLNVHASIMSVEKYGWDGIKFGHNDEYYTRAEVDEAIRRKYIKDMCRTFAYNESFTHIAKTVPSILTPLIRRVMPSLIANHILGVQPITAPVGNIFQLKHKPSP